jgi:hypothetical protein
MRVMSLGVLSFLFLLNSLVGSEPKEDYKLTNKLIYIDQHVDPQLFYLCFKKKGEPPHHFYYLDSRNEVLAVAEINNYEFQPQYEISSVFCNSIDQFILQEELNRIGLSHDSLSFLANKQDIINQFVADFDFREQEILLSSHFKAQKAVSDHPKTKKEKPKEFDSSIWLMAGGALLLTLLGYMQAPRFLSKGKHAQVRSMRKKWVNILWEKGIIDANGKGMLLSYLDSLPHLIRSGQLSHLDLPPSGADPELENALRRRKSGESVVKTKETSLDNTSR